MANIPCLAMARAGTQGGRVRRDPQGEGERHHEEGARRAGRDFIRKGDTLVVTRIDRLARSIADLQDIVRTLKARGATLRATERPIDTSTAAGKCFPDMLGVFAECQLLSATIAIAMLKNNQADASIKVGSKGTTNISKRSPA
jgi:hypothetical protein